MKLSSGGTIRYEVTPTVTMDEIDTDLNAIYSVMVMSGYLKAMNGGLDLAIPNTEMYKVFSSVIMKGFPMLSGYVRDFASYLLEGDTEKLAGTLESLFERGTSDRILDNEHVYQAFIAGMAMSLLGQYEVTVERESGNGYHDIMLRSRSWGRANVVIELKRAKGSDELVKVANEGITQIKEKGYASGLKGRTLLYGIAFFGKKPFIASEILDLRTQHAIRIARMQGTSHLFKGGSGTGAVKQLPIGVQDFKTVIEEDYYYVDKSMLIGQMLDDVRNGVFLYTRPRRFGKSLNLSMIDAFFNIKYKGNAWFDGLEISKHHGYDQYKNAFPVMKIDLKDLGYDFIQFQKKMTKKFSLISDQFGYLKDSDKLTESDRELFVKINKRTVDTDESASALEDLSRMLHAHHGVKAVILIDEYDNPMNSFHGHEDFDKVRRYIRDMMSSTLKGNDSLQLGVVTGVMQIAKESIFSGLNNLKVNNVLSEQSDEMFGFTNDEVKKMCSDYGHPDKYEECKLWYDGYRFGNADIYNPWSVINYVDSGFKPQAYWAGTSRNEIIRDLLDIADDMIMDDISKLSHGEGIRGHVKTTVTMDDIAKDPRSIYSVMVVSGYLKAENKGACQILTIPNTEMCEVFSDMLFESLPEGNDSARMFTDCLVQGDVDGVTESLKSLFENNNSIRILTNGYAYQAFIAGLSMGLLRKYDITVDRESGNGFHDIRFVPKMPGLVNVIIEVKKSNREDVRLLAKDAIEQIKKKDYMSGLKGKIILYGIAFDGKEPFVISKIINQRNDVKLPGQSLV